MFPSLPRDEGHVAFVLEKSKALNGQGLKKYFISYRSAFVIAYIRDPCRLKRERGTNFGKHERFDGGSLS